MSEQAIETDDETQIVVDEGESPDGFTIEDDDPVDEQAESEQDEDDTEEADDEGEIEIFVEGEDEPASKPARKNGFARRIDKLRGKITEASEQKTEAERRAAALEEENRLLRMQMEQRLSNKEPQEDDFDSDAEYRKAKAEFDDRRLKALAQQEAQAILERTHQQTTHAAREKEKERLMLDHYSRAEEANIPDYEQLEDAVIDVLGKDIVSEIMANTDKSHLVIAHLGVNLDKAEQFARQAKVNPFKTVMDIGTLAASLKTRRKHSRAADPETTIDRGMPKADSIISGARFE